MREIYLLSMFSTAQGYLARYIGQVNRMAREMAVDTQGDSLHCLWVEGDSEDDTWRVIQEITELDWKHDFTAIAWQHHHGQDLRRGTAHPDRLANLSRIWNEMLDAVPESADMVVIVESDLVWQPETLQELIARSAIDGNIHAPMVWLDDAFYDTYEYRRNGRRFINYPPYHPDLRMGKPLELDSAGSCLVMLGEVARAHRTTETHELMGLCHSAREAGRKVILDSDLSVYQPVEQWVGKQSFEGVI